MTLHRRDLVRYAEGIVGHDGSGEDVVQEAFWRHVGGVSRFLQSRSVAEG
jgi:DNA-directed RNA polymerase specialized sigma24 family protein